jgi:hypothetical protein
MRLQARYPILALLLALPVAAQDYDPPQPAPPAAEESSAATAPEAEHVPAPAARAQEPAAPAPAATTENVPAGEDVNQLPRTASPLGLLLLVGLGGAGSAAALRLARQR